LVWHHLRFPKGSKEKCLNATETFLFFSRPFVAFSADISKVHFSITKANFIKLGGVMEQMLKYPL